MGKDRVSGLKEVFCLLSYVILFFYLWQREIPLAKPDVFKPIDRSKCQKRCKLDMIRLTTSVNFTGFIESLNLWSLPYC
jgi:hypothetical protein